MIFQCSTIYSVVPHPMPPGGHLTSICTVRITCYSLSGHVKKECLIGRSIMSNDSVDFQLCENIY